MPQPLATTKQPRGPFSPYFGCTIFAVIIMGAVLILGLVVWSGTTQDAAIAAFTVDAPVKLARQTLPEAERAALQQKLTAFSQKQSAELLLTMTELNTLMELAPQSEYGAYTEMASFVKTDAEKQLLVADICLPMNKLKFWEGKRYAVGSASFQPRIGERGIDLQLMALAVPGKTVSEDFLSRLSQWRWLEHYARMEGMTDLMAAVKRVEVTADAVKLYTTP